jgi:hypothetical protein
MAIITTGWTYKFTFIQKFAELDGIYTITKIYSWAEVLNEQLSLYDILYAPLNIPETIYNEDIKTYKNEDILKLISPVDGTELYVPTSILSSNPLYTVKEYNNLVLFINLGTYDDVSGLDYLVSQVGDEVKSVLGIGEQPKITSVSKVYLTEQEYKELENTRQDRITTILNWFSALKTLEKENNLLRAQLGAYRQLVQEKLIQNP